MKQAALAVAGLIALTLATFAPIVSHGFVNWDDQSQLYQNSDFNPPTAAKIAKYWRQPHMNLYLPVTYSAWGLIASIAQRDAPGPDGEKLDARYFHAANLLAHVCSVLLVFAVFRALDLPLLSAVLGAALFAVHPVMVEPVAWASSLYTVLSGMFSLAAIWQAVLALRAAKRKWLHAALATIAFGLAMLAKPSAVVVPIIVLVLAVLLVRCDWRRAWTMPAAWVVLAIPIMIIANRAQPAEFVADVPLWQRPIIAGDAITFYLGKVIVPLRLAADYGRFPQRVMSNGFVYLSALVPIALLALAWRMRATRPWLLASLLVFIAAMGTYLGFKKFDFQYYSTVADRYLYLSMLGVALAIAFAARNRAAIVVISVIVFMFAIRSFIQTSVWRDTSSLFEHTLRVNAHSVVAHNTLGYLAARHNDRATAAMHYRAALATRPQDNTAHFNLGNLLLAQGQFEEAIAHYRVAAETARGERRAAIEINLGTALVNLGRFDEAEAAYLDALAADPDSKLAQQNLARLRQKR
jgi:Flp pilus assembly protein TadD